MNRHYCTVSVDPQNTKPPPPFLTWRYGWAVKTNVALKCAVLSLFTVQILGLWVESIFKNWVLSKMAVHMTEQRKRCLFKASAKTIHILVFDALVDGLVLSGA